jgi:hypothetical protein
MALLLLSWLNEMDLLDRAEATWGGFMTSSRVTNTATSNDVAKALRANSSSLGDFSSSDPEELCRRYKDFIIDLLYVTPRPTKGILVPGCLKAFEVNAAQANMFSERILCAITFCRDKAHSMTSGKKVCRIEGVKEIVDVMLKVKQTSLQQLVGKGKNLLPVLEESQETGKSVTPSKLLRSPPDSCDSQECQSAPSKACFSVFVLGETSIVRVLW